MRRAAPVAVAAALCLVALPAVVQAAKFKTEVTVTNSRPGVYSGKVTSTKKGCVEGRIVQVWHDTNGNGAVDGEPTDYLIGSTNTDAAGGWSLGGEQAPIGDSVIAQVNRKKLGKRKNCGAASATTVASPG
jgi:hypothetical protein